MVLNIESIILHREDGKAFERQQNDPIRVYMEFLTKISLTSTKREKAPTDFFREKAIFFSVTFSEKTTFPLTYGVNIQSLTAAILA